MVRVVCAVIKEQKGRVLLVKRSATMAHPGQWEFPGGKVEEGEGDLDALKREIREELGVEIRAVKNLPSYQYHYPNKKIVLVPVICEIRSGIPALSEHCDFIWLNIQEIDLNTLVEADREIIPQLKELL